MQALLPSAYAVAAGLAALMSSLDEPKAMSWKRTLYHTWLCLMDFLLPTRHGTQRRHDINTGKRKRWD